MSSFGFYQTACLDFSACILDMKLVENVVECRHIAVDYFENGADKNHWASYQLGRIYLFGAKDIERDKEKAIEWFTKSANDGNEYAQAMLDNISKFENDLLVNTIFSLFVSLSRCIQDSYDNDRKDLQSIVDRKLMRVIRKKEMKLGEKEENHMDIQ